MPIVLAVAPSGARRQKSEHAGVPFTDEELAREAAACRERGATLLHLHVRDAAGRHSLDPDLYRDAIAAVRRAAGPRLVVQITTEAVNRFTPREQVAAVRAVAPEAVSLAVRELVPDAGAEPTAARFLEECFRAGCLVQFILYSHRDVLRYGDLVARGVVPEENASVLFVLGRHGPAQASTDGDLARFLSSYRGKAAWFACAFGATEHACMLEVARRGGHARVGFETNVLLADGRPAPTNAALVEQLAAALPATGRAIATYEETRRILGARA